MQKTKHRSGFRPLLTAILAACLFLPAAWAQSGASPDPSVDGPPGPTFLRTRPLTREERCAWFVDSTVGPKSLAAGVVSSAWSTAFNNPEEYGPHWDGFAKRYGMRLTGIAASNGIEAGLGSAWGEDPRYTSAADGSVWSRVKHAAKMTAYANNADGSVRPAYARYAGITGSNFLSNTWRAESDSTVGAATKRTALGFAGKFVSNAFDEFWPDIHKKLFGRK
jgi:hypothetical protein